MPKDLHGQPLVTTLANSDRIAAGVPGQVGAKNILYEDLEQQILDAIGGGGQVIANIDGGDSDDTYTLDFDGGNSI